MLAFSFGPARAASMDSPEGGEADAPAHESASADEFDRLFEAELEHAVAVSDPFEPANRALFQLNRGIDWLLLEPAARTYGWLMPAPGKEAVQRFFANLNGPVHALNHLLQGRPAAAGTATLRFLVNSTLGILGTADVASRLDLQPRRADFGQTLSAYGLGEGPYLVLPLLGPTTARDAGGTLVDALVRVDTWIFPPHQQLFFATGSGVSKREDVLEELDDLERTSVDFYSAIRTLYLGRRRGQLDGSRD